AAWLQGAGGAHLAEFVAQAVARPRAAERPRPAPVVVPDRVVYGPDSDWTYLKLYLGGQAVDGFVATALFAQIEALRVSGALDRWFFVRYGDVANHLRVRAHATPGCGARAREALLGAAGAWLSAGTVARYAIDTYDPEYERYGGAERLLDVERFFTFDSERCAAVLAEGIGERGARIEAAAASFDDLLRGDPELGRLVLETYEETAKKKLGDRDRESLRRLGTMQTQAQAGVPLLQRALESERAHKRLADLVHLHCNRLGLLGEDEERVCRLLRALALARSARAGRREPQPVG
ncbi:MAG TPA: thiopeptide-type bacteriocin biosynthesis protein, partial [Verrucomicrobiae bacterium]|nr:thiopeptide-type bacteriocin biosynthesis protein [Verrucomicrobiae bacterium]